MKGWMKSRNEGVKQSTKAFMVYKEFRLSDGDNEVKENVISWEKKGYNTYKRYTLNVFLLAFLLDL